MHNLRFVDINIYIYICTGQTVFDVGQSIKLQWLFLLYILNFQGYTFSVQHIVSKQSFIVLLKSYALRTVFHSYIVKNRFKIKLAVVQKPIGNNHGLHFSAFSWALGEVYTQIRSYTHIKEL